MKLIDLDADQGYLLDGKYKIEPIVRCKDCRFYDDIFRQCKIIRRHFAPMSYCSKGERKDQEDEEEDTD